MTPEERLVHLRDGEAWTIRAIRPRFALGAKPRPRLVMQIVTPIAAGIVVAAVVAYGITAVLPDRAVQPAVPTPTQTDSPTPSPTPSPTGTAIDVVEPAGVWQSPPAEAFGGDCNALFTEAQMAEFMGTPKAKLVDWQDVVRVQPQGVVAEHNGGMKCQWDDGTGQDVEPGSHPVVDAVVLSAAALGVTQSSFDCDPSNECTFVEGAGGYVVTGSIGLNESEKSTMELVPTAEHIVAGIQQALPAVAAAAGPPPPAWRERAGDWAPDYDCAEFKNLVDFESSGAASRYADSDPYGAGHGATSCFIGEYAGVLIETLSGGAWLEDRIAAIDGMNSATVAGADRAYAWNQTHPEGSTDWLYVIDGSNLLVIGLSQGLDTAIARTTATKVLAYLDMPTAGSAYVTTAGYGDLKLGKPVPSSTKLVEWTTPDFEGCASTGYWEPTASDDFPFFVQATKAGPIDSLMIRDPSITTKSGAHVGMTLKEIDALFPSATKESSDIGKLRVVSDSLGEVVFEIGDKSAGVEYYTGPAAKKVVLYIHVLQPGALHFYAQGGGIGYCI